MNTSKPDWKDAPEWATVLLTHKDDDGTYCFAEKHESGSKFKRGDSDKDCTTLWAECWNLAECRPVVPQTSKEKPSFVSFFTSVIVAKNKAVSDMGEMLYDENTTKISLEDEGGGAFLIVEQDHNGAIQQIRLDIDELDTVFSAIKQLVNQMEIRS